MKVEMNNTKTSLAKLKGKIAGASNDIGKSNHILTDQLYVDGSIEKSKQTILASVPSKADIDQIQTLITDLQSRNHALEGQLATAATSNVNLQSKFNDFKTEVDTQISDLTISMADLCEELYTLIKSTNSITIATN